MAQTPTDFNFLIREVCQHPFKAGLKIQALLRDEAELLTALIESSVLLHFKLESTPCRRNTELRNSRSSLPSSRKRHANRAEYQKERRQPGQAQVGHPVQIKDRHYNRGKQEKDSKQSQNVRHRCYSPFNETSLYDLYPSGATSGRFVVGFRQLS